MIQEYEPLAETLLLDIFSSPRKLDLKSLPCPLIYDTSIADEKGLSFDELSSVQILQLDAVLKKYKQQ